jgi:CHAD domain-containing protein
MELDYVKLKEIKPALTGNVKESRELLKRGAFPDEEVVHDLRVLMKKSRALLKLVSPQLDNEYITRDIVAMREVGRKMRIWRETAVNRKTLKELKKEFPDIFSRLPENEKINSILKKPDSFAEPSEKMKSELNEINNILNKAGYRMRFHSMNKIDPQLLIKELDKTYNSVGKIYLKCRNYPKPDNIHELRKKAKDFLYQIYLFRPLNPVIVKELEKKLDSMTRYLGRFNDLTQLIINLDYEYSFNENSTALDELVIRIREKQDLNLSKVWPIAYKVFCPGQKLLNVLGFKLLVI